ncbi:MAG: hypothetical protein LBJ08_11295 [Bifidobacteriaceae bacterium]|nr:hypothetical protein [Bifidobacteriaceae bacterium]
MPLYRERPTFADDPFSSWTQRVVVLGDGSGLWWGLGWAGLGGVWGERGSSSLSGRRAGVFGSVARNEDAEGSDIDLSDPLGVSVDVVDDEEVFARDRGTGMGVAFLRETVAL